MNRRKCTHDVPLIALAALIAFGALTPCAFPLTEEEAIFEQGKDDLFVANYYRAASRFRRLLSEYPDTKFRKEALLLLSNACLKSGRTEKARDHLQTLVRDYPGEEKSLAPELRMLAGINPEAPAAPQPREGQSPYRNVFSPSVPFAPVPAREPEQPAPKPVPVPQFQKAEAARVAIREVPPPDTARTPVQSDPSTVEPQYYTVVAGEPLTAAKRDSLVKKLRKRGFDPTVTAATKSFTVQRLVEGRYDSADAAEARRVEVLRSCGGSPFVVRMEGAHCVVAGSYASTENATVARRTMEKKGVRVEVVEADAPLKVWRVTVGRYRSAGEAETAAARMYGIGAAARVELGQD